MEIGREYELNGLTVILLPEFGRGEDPTRVTVGVKADESLAAHLDLDRAYVEIFYVKQIYLPVSAPGPDRIETLLCVKSDTTYLIPGAFCGTAAFELSPSTIQFIRVELTKTHQKFEFGRDATPRSQPTA